MSNRITVDSALVRVEFTHAELPKTFNSLLSGNKDSRWQRKAEADKWHNTIFLLTAEHRPYIGGPWKKAKLTLTRRSSVAPDPDGLVSSFKYIVDALVKVGLLVDDNMEVIGFPDYRWEKAPRGQGSIHVIVEKTFSNSSEDRK